MHKVRVCLAGVLVVVACVSPTSPEANILVSARASQTHVRLGEPVTVTLTVINQGDRDVSVAWNTCPILPFVIRSTEGGEVGTGLVSGGCLLSLNSTTIAPQDSATLNVEWDGTVQERTSGSAYPLMLGSYHLYPRLTLDSGLVVEGKVPLGIEVIE